MATIRVWAFGDSGETVYFQFTRSADRYVLDNNDNTWKANKAACTDFKWPATENTDGGDADESEYFLEIDGDTLNATSTAAEFLVGGFYDKATDEKFSRGMLWVASGAEVGVETTDWLDGGRLDLILDTVASYAASSAAWGYINSGIVFRGVVSAADPGVSFTIGGLAGQGVGSFIDPNTPWYAYVFRDAGGVAAAPQGEQQRVTGYTSATGLFTTEAFSTPVAVGDDVIIMSGRIAAVPDILEDTGTTLPAQINALNNVSADQVNAEVDQALADYDPPTKAEMDAGFAGVTSPVNLEITDTDLVIE